MFLKLSFSYSREVRWYQSGIRKWPSEVARENCDVLTPPAKALALSQKELEAIPRPFSCEGPETHLRRVYELAEEIYGGARMTLTGFS
jgi:hypothetical protein